MRIRDIVRHGITCYSRASCPALMEEAYDTTFDNVKRIISNVVEMVSHPLADFRIFQSGSLTDLVAYYDYAPY